jgi:hypothetical protein
LRRSSASRGADRVGLPKSTVGTENDEEEEAVDDVDDEDASDAANKTPLFILDVIQRASTHSLTQIPKIIYSLAAEKSESRSM